MLYGEIKLDYNKYKTPNGREKKKHYDLFDFPYKIALSSLWGPTYL